MKLQSVKLFFFIQMIHLIVNTHCRFIYSRKTQIFHFLALLTQNMKLKANRRYLAMEKHIFV